MQMTVMVVLGLVIGGGLFVVLRPRPIAAVWTALALGVVADVLLVGGIFTSLLPDMGRLTFLGIGVPSGVGTALALGLVLKGERKPLNWVALAVAGAPVLFLIVFGVGELVGPPH